MPPSLPPESHYDPKKLDKLFAIAAVILLLSLVGMFAKDYSRQWKDYQRDFRSMEVEKAQVKLDAERSDLAGNQEYQALAKQVADTQKKLKQSDEKIADIKKRMAKAETAERLHTQKYQFAKAEYDSMRFRYESARHSKAGNADRLQKELARQDEQVQQLQVQVDADKKAVKKISDEQAAIEKEFKDLEKKRLALAKKRDIIERKLASSGASTRNKCRLPTSLRRWCATCRLLIWPTPIIRSARSWSKTSRRTLIS
jgi:chromosome segregation ATPase